MSDSFEIEVLGDGTVKVTTEEISAGNHRGADQLMKLLGQLMGGETVDVGGPAHRRSRSHSHQSAGRKASHGH